MLTQNNALSKTVRNSSIELLRIIAMIFVVFNHYANHGQFNFGAQDLTLPRFWWSFIKMPGYMFLNVFVMISGYFLVKDNKTLFNFKRVLKFWGQVFFYSVVFYFVFVLTGRISFEPITFIKALLPISFEYKWFASAYFIIYLLHPFINVLLNKLDKAAFQKLLILMVIMWCIIPTFLTQMYQSNRFIWCVTMYCVGGYIRLYGLNSKFKTKHYLITWFVIIVLEYLSFVLLALIGTKIELAYEHSTYFFAFTSVFAFLGAVAIFMVFLNIDIGNHKWINVIASATFGVYLIHDNVMVRSYLWLELFRNADYQGSNMLVFHSLGVVLLVYAVCTLIDLARQQVFERPYMKLVNNCSDSVLNPFKKLYSRFVEVIFGA